jgi:transcriptional regulator with XRE-family HTH domain
MSGRTSRPGRVAGNKVFEPAIRKRRLVQHKAEDTTVDSAKIAEAGAWLKQLREGRGLSQPQMVTALGMKHRAAISMIESGKNRLAPVNFEIYAEMLCIEPREFVRQLLSYYSPEVYEILFGDVADQPASSASATDLT